MHETNPKWNQLSLEEVVHEASIREIFGIDSQDKHTPLERSVGFVNSIFHSILAIAFCLLCTVSVSS